MVTGPSVSMLNSTKRLGSTLPGNTVLCSHLSPPRCIKMGTCDLNAVRSPCKTGLSSKGNTKYSTSLHATEIRGPFLERARKLFGPEKPFSINLYLKTERYIRLKLLVWRELLFRHINNMWIKQLCNHKVRDFATAFRVRKLFRTFEKRAPG